MRLNFIKNEFHLLNFFLEKRREGRKKREKTIAILKRIRALVHCACWRFDNLWEVRRDKIDPRRWRGWSGEARSLSFFEFRLRSLSGHLEEISSVLASGTFLENARREENRTVNQFAILSISLIAIKVMSYGIDCPHKIVSSPFCGPDSAKRISSSEARNKWPLSPLFRATLLPRQYHKMRLDLCDIYT